MPFALSPEAFGTKSKESSDVVEIVSTIIWPGKNAEASWEEFSSQNLKKMVDLRCNLFVEGLRGNLC